jgi:hypothetical protein
MERVISHYVRIEVRPNGELDVFLVEETFDQGEYGKAQIKWAHYCPYNRHAVRQKMKWSDRELDQNPEALLDHFVAEHGDDWFRDNLRPKFIKTRQTRLENVNLRCLSASPEDRCRECDICITINSFQKA